MTIASKPIKKIEMLEDLNAEYIVLSAVVHELYKLQESKQIKRAKAARAALNIINFMNINVINAKGKPIDDLIIDYAIANNAYVATIDSEMRRKLREEGIGIITLSRDRIIFE
jgi:rRNA-processing protein FCF1